MQRFLQHEWFNHLMEAPEGAPVHVGAGMKRYDAERFALQLQSIARDGIGVAGIAAPNLEVVPLDDRGESASAGRETSLLPR